MSFIKKSNRKFRQRVRHECDDSDEDMTSVKSDNQTVQNNVNHKPIINAIHHNIDDDFDDIYRSNSNSKQISSRLSFQDEEEDCDVFKVKKSSYSRRIMKQLERDKRSKNKNKAPIVEPKPIVNHINNNDINLILIKSEQNSAKPETNNDKKEVKEELKILSGDDANNIIDDLDECDEYTSNEPFYHFRGALERGVIPDAKTIYALKKQRQMARDVTEIIPLVDDNDDSYEEINNSRLIREEDDDKSDEDDDDDQRINFAVTKDNTEREKKEAFIYAQEVSEDEDSYRKQDSDDELERWEREQIRRGVRMPAILEQDASGGQFYRQSLFADNLTVIDMDIDNPTKNKRLSIPSAVLERNRVTTTFDAICERLANKLSTMKESLDSNKRQLVNVNVDMKMSQQEIVRISGLVKQKLCKIEEQNLECSDKQNIGENDKQLIDSSLPGTSFGPQNCGSSSNSSSSPKR